MAAKRVRTEPAHGDEGLSGKRAASVAPRSSLTSFSQLHSTDASGVTARARGSCGRSRSSWHIPRILSTTHRAAVACACASAWRARATGPLGNGCACSFADSTPHPATLCRSVHHAPSASSLVPVCVFCACVFCACRPPGPLPAAACAVVAASCAARHVPARRWSPRVLAAGRAQGADACVRCAACSGSCGSPSGLRQGCDAPPPPRTATLAGPVSALRPAPSADAGLQQRRAGVRHGQVGRLHRPRRCAGAGTAARVRRRQQVGTDCASSLTSTATFTSCRSEQLVVGAHRVRT